jgi:protein tyrosine kinase modulator
VLPGKTLKADDIVRMLVRRRWLILLPLAAGLSMVPVIARFVPKVYRSESLVMVIPQRVPDSYVKSTVTATVEDRLPSISDQILSRSRLERIITDYNLYQKDRATSPMEDVVVRMRSDVGPISIREGEKSFRVGYTNRDPATAQKVATRLASLFIDENSRERESLAENTNVFIESQLEEAKLKLVEHERKLEVFRRSHTGELPSQLEGNLRAIQGAQLLLQSTSESINRARERRLLIERQLVDARTLPLAAAPISATQTAATPGVPVAQQLEAERARLEVMRQRYTADHPDVRASQRLIRELQQKADEEAKRPAPERSQVKVVSREEQDREKKIRELEAEIEVIDHQLSVGQVEEARLKSVIDDYQHKVEAVPGRESELVELTRDYEVLKKGYDSLLTRREDSKLSANLERRQISEQFRVLDAASLPERPVNQAKRLAMIFSGAIASLVLGLAIAVILEITNSSFAREDEIARVLSLPVLALVPLLTSDQERRRHRRWQLAGDVAASLVFVASAALVVVWGLSQR